MSAKVGSIDRRENGVYFRAELARLKSGRWYRVHDIDLSGTRVRRAPLESLQATHRVFVQADTGRWSYAFGAGEIRTLTVPALERQLEEARYTMPDHRRGSPR